MRLEHGKTGEFQRCKPSARSFWLATGRLSSNLVAAAPRRDARSASRNRESGECRLRLPRRKTSPKEGDRAGRNMEWEDEVVDSFAGSESPIQQNRSRLTPMNITFAWAIAASAFALALGPADSARAALLTAPDASRMIQSTTTDTDFEFLNDFVGWQVGQTVNYNSSTSATTWTGALSGSYLGVPLNVAYSGDLSAYPPGPVTWTDAGSYGIASWTGSGSATITDTSPTTFQVVFTDSLTVGGNTASLDYTIPGTVLAGGTIVFGSAAGDEVGAGTGMINGMALANRCYSYKDAAMTIQSDIVIRPDDKACDDFHTDDNIYVKDNGGLLLTGTISTTIPEPSSILLSASALSTLLLLRRRGRGKRVELMRSLS